MSASNLAICFAPAVFHLCGLRTGSTSSSAFKRNRKHSLGGKSSSTGGVGGGGGGGMPSEKDLRDQGAAQQCLTCLINHAKTIFTVS